MGKKGERAKELFYEGYSCAQSVAGAFSEELGLPLGTVTRMVSGFGAGFGRMREVCGAFSGITFVASALYGYSDPTAKEDKTRTYAMIQTLAEHFRARCGGSIICRELLGLAKAEGTAEASARTAEYYKKRPCPEIAAEAADILEEWIEADPPLYSAAAELSGNSRTEIG